MKTKDELRKKILEIATFHDDNGTSGYLLSDEMVDKIIELIDSEVKLEREKLDKILKIMREIDLTLAGIDMIL